MEIITKIKARSSNYFYKVSSFKLDMVELEEKKPVKDVEIK